MQGAFLCGAGGEVAVVAQGVFLDVGEVVAYVQRRVAFAVEVEVEPVEVCAVHEVLVGVAVAVDAANRAVVQGFGQGSGWGDEGMDARGKFGMDGGGFVQAVVQQGEFVFDVPAACDRDVAVVQGGDGAANIRPQGGRAVWVEQFGGGATRDLAL